MFQRKEGHKRDNAQAGDCHSIGEIFFYDSDPIRSGIYYRGFKSETLIVFRRGRRGR